MSADSVEASSDPPLTVELLADLQAGLLDDEAAARLRGRVRADPAATAALRALQRVRCDIAALATDSTSVPEAPSKVAANVAAALRSANPSSLAVRNPSGRSRGAHSMRPSGSRAKVGAAVAGVCAVVAAAGVGTAALVGAPAPTPDPAESVTTARHITVSSPAVVIPLSDGQILGLLDYGPDYGPLSDPARRASCLGGLGYPASTPILGARPIEMTGQLGVLLLLPGDTTDSVAVVAVRANCGSADTGLLATTRIARR